MKKVLFVMCLLLSTSVVGFTEENNNIEEHTISKVINVDNDNVSDDTKTLNNSDDLNNIIENIKEEIKHADIKEDGQNVPTVTKQVKEAKNETKTTEIEISANKVINTNINVEGDKGQKNQQENLNNLQHDTSINNIIESKQNNSLKKSGVSNSNFVSKWLIPEQNPAFGDDKYVIGIQYGYDMTNFLPYGFGNQENKTIHYGAIQYGASTNFLGLHGRSSVGIGYLYGQDYWAKNQAEGKYNTPLIEFVQEAIVGSRYLYLFAGVGISWVMKPASNYEMQHIWHIKNRHTRENEHSKYQKGGMTSLNIPLTIGIGHRFDCGLVLEVAWKHYSNGHVAEYNSAVNTLSVAIRYTFGKK